MSKTDDSEAKKDQLKAEESAKGEAKPATEPLGREEEEDDEEEEDEEGRAAAPVKPELARRTVKTQPSRRGEQKTPPPKATSLVPMPRVALFVVVALAAGAAGGWFGQEAQAKARVKAESAAAPAGSGAAAGPCGAWQSKVCDSAGAGDKSAVCTQAKGAAELLAPSTCESALSMMPATLAKVKVARKSCDTLVSKLCKDLPPNASSCGMVKEKTPEFPSQRCDEMLQHYDEVLASLRQLEEQGGMPGGPGGPGRPGMQRPPGAVPGH